MTNIEKLYELAEVEKITFSAVIQGEFPQRIHERCYPPFTPEKQLELIKWFDYFSYFPTIGAFHMLFHFKDKQYHKIGFVSFEDTLAWLVCELWEDLTDEQKAEIKRILE